MLIRHKGLNCVIPGFYTDIEQSEFNYQLAKISLFHNTNRRNFKRFMMSLIHKTSASSKYKSAISQNKQSIALSQYQRLRIDGRHDHGESALLNAAALDNTLDSILLGMPEPILIASLAGIIRSVNASAEKLLGDSSANLIEQNISSIFTSELAPSSANAKDSQFTPGAWHCLTPEPSPVIRKRSGEIVIADVTRLDFIADGLPVCAYKLTDATKVADLQNRLDEAIRETAVLSRLAILGELTAAIAHELSQPLT
ncbi:MAG: PAS domain-containing protein, partial [Hyphomicrobiales bacterium]|nr:PAS domain-containing protein [Hyphomicrobiales bacterium]